MKTVLTGKRISVVGTSGSGKTTIGRQLSQQLELPHIEIDALYWDKDWTGVDEALFRERITQAIQGEAWVIDGNYSRIRHLVWGRADTVVYLDYSFGRILWQLLGRTLRRAFSQEELWSGNRESLRQSFFSKDSILWWMLSTYHRRRRQYAELLQKPEYAHLEVVHLRSPRQTSEWMANLSHC